LNISKIEKKRPFGQRAKGYFPNFLVNISKLKKKKQTNTFQRKYFQRKNWNFQIFKGISFFKGSISKDFFQRKYFQKKNWKFSKEVLSKTLFFCKKKEFSFSKVFFSKEKFEIFIAKSKQIHFKRKFSKEGISSLP